MLRNGRGYVYKYMLEFLTCVSASILYIDYPSVHAMDGTVIIHYTPPCYFDVHFAICRRSLDSVSPGI